MKLATVRTETGPRLVAAHSDDFIDLQQAVERRSDDKAALQGTTSLRQLLESGDHLFDLVQQLVEDPDPPLARHQGFLPPVVDPRKILCLGRNYHPVGEDAPPATEPEIFPKLDNALIGHEEAIRIPAQVRQVDFEAELAIVIGRVSTRVPVERALQHVAGYTILHDVSARDAFLPVPRAFAGKSFDTFAPVGPWIVTADEITDPQRLRIRTWVNGDLLQDDTTAHMRCTVAEAIAYVSSLVTLVPGDIIATGTPPGVGATRNPPRYLRQGDVVEMELERVGLLRNHVVTSREGNA